MPGGENHGYLQSSLRDDAMVFHGDVINTRDVITFQGQSVAELTEAFRESVDNYPNFCQQRGELPEKPFLVNSLHGFRRNSTARPTSQRWLPA